ncbi:hypothetical protein AXF42_Ash008345 [Apostasia shenzhenica]|uniref:Transcription elongation factor n=1 Tax=Apostasia shenzhenica TaxID=1088818 RepID=A0A2I0AXN2_9ASPA|nr:hypothetical protein AXF42_Ash008345 [Apostasia shenzhenica]
MEKEILSAYEVAEKAADAAAADDGAAEEDRCVDALKRLRRMPVATKDLVATQVGKRIRRLTKHPKPRIQEIASDLFKFWKNVVVEETSKDCKKSSSSEDARPLKTEAKFERSESIKDEKTPKSESVKVEKLVSGKRFESEIASRPGSVKIGNAMSQRSNGVESIKVQKLSKEEQQPSVAKKPPVPAGPPKFTSMVKCNDPVRDKLRELLAEAFSKVFDEAGKDERQEVRNILDEIDACDPIRVAVTVESVMFEKLGRSNGSHKVKYRSIMFNLKDAKNTDLRRRVLLGHITPQVLINMTAEEMASDERKLANKQIQEKALFECERAGAPKATTDQFKCGRCGQRKCTYYQLQTRSADEPMTTFVTCVNCNNHWKFC